MKTTTCDIVLVIDGEGNWGVGPDYETAKDAYEASGDTDNTNGTRVFHLNLAVPLPVAARIVGILPDQGGGEVALTVV